MSLDQALYEMELVGHDFFLFVDADSSVPSVVYRRRGWSYGVIRLDRRPPPAPPGRRQLARLPGDGLWGGWLRACHDVAVRPRASARAERAR